MATDLDLDDNLIEEARRLGRHRTKKEAITRALEEYIRRRKQQRVLRLFGTVDYDSAYNYKAERRKART
jgi:Arc/MetJ family transcription regulator